MSPDLLILVWLLLTVTSEKIIKQDTDQKYDILVIGEESHVAYNRVGLSSFFEHRKIEDLYLNPKEWVCITTGNCIFHNQSNID